MIIKQQIVRYQLVIVTTSTDDNWIAQTSKLLLELISVLLWIWSMLHIINQFSYQFSYQALNIFLGLSETLDFIWSVAIIAGKSLAWGVLT